MERFTTSSKVKIAIADDHPIVCEGLKLFIRDSSDFSVSYIVHDGEELLSIINSSNTDVLLLDLKMPKMNGIECIKMIRKKFPNIKIIVLSSTSKVEKILTCINLGVNSFISKAMVSNELQIAIRKVIISEFYYCDIITQLIKDHHKKILINDPVFAKTGIYFTETEKKLLKLIFLEYNNDEIAKKMNLSKRTIECHRLNIVKKIGCKGTLGVLKFILKYDILDDDE